MHVRARLGRTVLVAAAVALFLAPVGQMTAAREQAPRVTLQPCGRERGAAFASAECGALRVFENRRTRQGRTIDVAFARWRSGAPAPAATATFLIAGGPGADGASLARAPETWARPLRSTMDIVIVDQRGTGRSNALFCPQDVDARPGSAFGHVFDPAWIRQCRRLLEAKADLMLYTTDLAVDDLDDVRAALGYERISLYGGSYGTRVAQAYMRRYPNRTRAVVLDGALPFDRKVPLTYAATAQQALDRVIDACAADPACRAAHPTLGGDFARLLARFDADPIATSVAPPGRPPVPVRMSRGDFGYAVRGILYSAAMIRDLPGWIGQAAATGDVSVFAQRYWERQLSFSRTFATGLHLSVLCAEDVAFIGEQEIAPAASGTFLGRYVIDQYRHACAEWPVAEVAADLRRPVAVPVPTLLVSGYFDPVTPPAFADDIGRRLPSARHVVSGRGAHGSVTDCALAAALFVLREGTLDAMPGACS